MKKAGTGLVIGIGFVVVIAVAAIAYGVFYDTPDFSQMKTSVEIPIRKANGELSTKRIGPQVPGWVPRSQISNFLADAVVASEDTSFYSHSGIDMHEIREAIKKDLKEGKFARGASTLTQQVLKNVFLGSDKTIWRKVREIILAPKLEKALTKTEILTFYLNMAEWAPGIYGCGEASRYYFNTAPANLTAKQAAFLTMLLPSPRRYHTYFRTRQLTAWANGRVNRILQIMFRMGQLDESQFRAAVDEQLWGLPALPDDAPGVPKDPGFVTDEGDAFFDNNKGIAPAGAPVTKEVPPPMPVSPSTPPANLDADSAASEEVEAAPSVANLP